MVLLESSLINDSHSLLLDRGGTKTDGHEHKYEIVKKLQEKKHIYGMAVDGVNDAAALKRADIVTTDVVRGASDTYIVLTEPGFSVIVSVFLSNRAIFQRMKNYTIYAVSITICNVVGFCD
ncbi:hypothetical protein L1987_16254 [Smallanthus sonchifolius]|uniref:Uncharacterized protein n=1 Tax=Smallanthus sonchifolius TaxID=185202 RepID=A0ACB9J9D2_9ASTR|nr:hypothetical protein L1987_16254 [Smallanthus sonchifolius]